MKTDNTINGRTPEEIKKWLECCQYSSKKPRDCDACPYRPEDDCYCFETVAMQDTLALIRQLERERDAAVEMLRGVGCNTCAFAELDAGEDPCVNCFCGAHWQMPGVQDV